MEKPVNATLLLSSKMREKTKILNMCKTEASVCHVRQKITCTHTHTNTHEHKHTPSLSLSLYLTFTCCIQTRK